MARASGRLALAAMIFMRGRGSVVGEGGRRESLPRGIAEGHGIATEVGSSGSYLHATALFRTYRQLANEWTDNNMLFGYMGV